MAANGGRTAVGFEQAIIACGSEPVTLPFIPHDDPRITARYEAIHLKTRVTNVEAGPDGVTVQFDGPKAPATDVFDGILVAVGRGPQRQADRRRARRRRGG